MNDDHNDARWYLVRWLDARKGGKGRNSGIPIEGLAAGWYVVRVCPCHFGEPVVKKPYPDPESADRGREVILSVWPT
jgi:hypothetical protein